MALSILANPDPISPEFERGAEESSILRQWRRGEHATQQTQESLKEPLWLNISSEIKT